VGRLGTILIVDRDEKTANGILASAFQIGSWNGRCVGHSYTLDALSPGAVGPGTGLTPSTFFVNAWIGCSSHDGTPGIGPQNCGI
jgi:hypothetical protein